MASLSIFQPLNGYCYNTDSLVLAHFAKTFLRAKNRGLRLLDIGAGSGILGLLCAREILESSKFSESSETSESSSESSAVSESKISESKKSLHLDLVEKNNIVSGIATQNLEAFMSQSKAKKFSAKVHNIDFLDFHIEQRYDFIITNPPFYTSGALLGKNEIKNMARFASFLPLEPFIAKIKKALAPNGVLCMCYDARLLAMLIAQLQLCGLHIDMLRFVHSLKDREASLVLIKAKINSKSPLSILPPLFTHKSQVQSDNTDELKEIYAWANTQSIKI